MQSELLELAVQHISDNLFAGKALFFSERRGQYFDHGLERKLKV